MCYNELVFSSCQGLSKARIPRLRTPSITGSTLIFSTTSHTTWSPFLLLCGPTLHIGMVFSFSVSKKDRYIEKQNPNSRFRCVFTPFYYLSDRIYSCLPRSFWNQVLSSRSGARGPWPARLSSKMRNRTGPLPTD